MSDETINPEVFAAPKGDENATRLPRQSQALGYAAALSLVAFAAIIAFVVETLAPASNLALIFVLPVLVAAVSYGWGSALTAALAGVVVFDFFFVQPLYSLRVTSPSDLLALALFLVVAAIASAVAGQSRRRALDAQRAAARAEALHGLAHLVVEAAPAAAVVEAAGVALSRIFQAPAVVLLNEGGPLQPAALVGGAVLSDSDKEAAQWALSNTLPTRADAFSFEKSRFDFWPIQRGGGTGIVLGVGKTASDDNRPAEPQRYVELVGAYLAASLSQVSESIRPEKGKRAK